MSSRLFNGTSDWIKLPFGFFYGATLGNGDAASYGIWIKSPGSASYKALLSSDAASSGGDVNVGWGLYWKNDALKVRYWYGGGSGTLEEKEVAFSTPANTAVFIAVTVSVAGGVPTWKFYAGATPATIAQVGTDQVGTGVPRASDRALAVGARTTGDTGSETPDAAFFEGNIQRVGYDDGEAWTLSEAQWFAATGSAQTIDPPSEGNGVSFEFTGEDPELDSGNNFWSTDSITGTSVAADIAPVVWTKKQTLFVDGGAYLSNNAFISVGGTDLLIGAFDGARVFKSGDLGNTWTEQDPLGTERQCNCLLYRGSDVVIAGSAFTAAKIFFSTDGGETWLEIGQLGADTIVNCLISLSNGDLLAGTSPNGKIYKSTNNGAAWSECDDISGELHITSLLDLGGGVVLAGAGNNKLYKSTDFGDTFAPHLTLPGTTGFVNDLFKVPSTTKILACNENEAYYSDDSGDSFTSVLESNITLFRRFIGPIDSKYYLVAENLGWVFESADEGATWPRIYSIPGWNSNTTGFALAASLLVGSTDQWTGDDANVWSMVPASVDEEEPAPDFRLRVDEAWRNLEYRYFGSPTAPAFIDPRVQILGATDLLMIAELGGFFDLHYKKSWTELDMWEMTLDADAPDGLSLKALGVVPKPAASSHILQVLINNVFDFAGRVESTEIKFAGGKTTYILKGRGVDSILADKLAIPPSGSATDSYTDIAENVMRALVDVNLISPQGTDVTGLNQAQRAVDLLDQTPNLSAGVSVQVEARNQTVFEVVREAALQDGGLGFQILIVGGQLLFDVFEGEDLSSSIVFNLNRDNLKSLSIKHDQSNYSTHLIMGGLGDGATRAMACAFLGVPPTGINRKERFQDAREISNDLKLQARGQAILKTEADYISFDCELLPVSPTQYKREFELGDLITGRVPEYDIELVKRIAEVDVVISEGHPLEVKVALGKAETRQNNMILRNALQATSRA